MIAQFWLWYLLSGLTGGILGWWARGRKTSGRELKVQREWNDRLSTVEEHAKRCLSRAREDAEASWERLAQERDALQAELKEFELASRGAARFAATRAETRPASRPGRRPRPSANGAAQRPAARNGARDRDDLTQLTGVGPVYEQLLNKMGYATFRDLATGGPAQIQELAEHFGARIQPDDLIAQAGRLHRNKYGVKA